MGGAKCARASTPSLPTHTHTNMCCHLPPPPPPADRCRTSPLRPQTGSLAFATKRSVKLRTGGSDSTCPTTGRLRRKPSTTGKKSPNRLRKPNSSMAMPILGEGREGKRAHTVGGGGGQPAQPCGRKKV
eukprot:scaffold1340_cov109-Isochrysis_galbana.AAC.5